MIKHPTLSKQLKSHLILATGILTLCAAHAVDVVSYTGTTYTQNFNSLPYTNGTSVNTGDPVTIGNATGSPTTATKFTFNGSANATFDFASAIDTSGTTSGSTGGLGLSSTMSGWYGGAQTSIKFGASAGDQTTGGIISFGALTSGDRALGLSATSTTGLTTFGIELVNNTGGTLNQINLQFTEELWRQQTTAQTMNVGYEVVATPSASMPLTGTSSLGSFGFATGTSTGSTPQSAPINTATFNSSGSSISIGNWSTGTALWITWQTSQSTGSSQELAIDNLSFSASLGASNPTWNTTSGTWTIGTGSNWTGGTGTVFNNGDNVTFNNTAGGTVTIDPGGVAPGSTTVSAISGTYTFTGGSIGGTGSLTKSGGGTLVLSSSNSYSGGTLINGGIISTGSDAALGNTSGGITFGGGTLQTSAGITSARPIALSGSGTIDTNGFDSTLTGNITGTGALTKIGSGTLTLSGTNSYSGGTTLSAGALTNNGSYAFGGGSVGISVTGSSTFTNNGTINQTGTGRAIRDNAGGLTFVVNNGSSTNSTALMQTADADVIQMNKPNSNVTLNNYGTMTSLNASAGGSQAVDFNAITTGSNTINNYSTGIMQAAEADAVRPGINGFVNNDGLIKSTTALGNSSDGIDAQTNSGITVVNAASAGAGTGTGTIEGGRHGITGGNTAVDINGNPSVNNGAYAMSITNNLGGTIKGDNGSGINIDGLNGNEVVTIVNHGTITGNGHDIGDGLAHDGDGVDVDGLVNITNTGTIRSINAFGAGETEFSEGVTVGGGTINNSGIIQGSVANGNTTAIGRGITIAGVDKQINFDGTETAIPVQAPYGAATITNSGSIIGDSDSAILFSSSLASGFSHTITNQPGGLIRTGSTTAPAILLAADNTTINNSGTINGANSGKAIAGGNGNLTLNILGGSASVLGDVTGGSGTNSLVIDPSAGHTFSYAGTITNFTTAQVKSGTFNLSGAMSAGGIAVNGGTLAGNGTVTGLVTVTTGGVISPGNSPGKLTLQTGVDFSGGGQYFWQLASLKDDGTGTAGTDFDQILLTGGNLTLGGTSQLTLDFSLLGGGDPNSANLYWQTNHTWTIIDGSGAANTGSTNFSAITDPTYADGFFTTSSDSNGNTVLNYQSVPEPGSAGLLVFDTLGLLARRRRA